MIRLPQLFIVATLLGVAAFPLRAEPLAPPAPMPAGVAAKAAPVEQILPEKSKRRKAADEFFQGPVIQLEFQFTPQQWNTLRAQNREYTECTLIETDVDGKKTTYNSVAVKLKGAAGSFQPPDRKPGLTINMDKFGKNDRFHGMDKFHLNNSMQDRGYLNEFVAGEWCRAAGVPASRCTHVLVKWNGRDNGLYVFKEGFTKDFLSAFYEKNDGSLYDGHFIADVDSREMEKQQGDPNDRSDLEGLAAATKQADEKLRWQQLYERLDVDEYLRFLALESFLGHWDGYNFTRNNYRIYFDSKTGKASFFAHGMDNLLNDANGPLTRQPTSLVGAAVMSNPEWKEHYNKVLDALYTKVIKPTDWDTRIVEQGKKIMEALARQDPQKAAAFESNIRYERDRVRARIAGIGRLLSDPDAPQGPVAGVRPPPPPRAPLDWKDGVLKVGAGQWLAATGQAQTVDLDGQKCFHLTANPSFPVAIRRTLMLEPGRYRLEGELKVSAVNGEEPSGAGLNIRGGGAKSGVKGTADWQKVTCEFDVTAGDTMLLAELRASAGEAWFRVDSLQLVKAK
jgi:hypothetical protein